MVVNDSNDSVEEQKLVKLYTELAGVPESCARNVFMFVCSKDEESPETVARGEGRVVAAETGGPAPVPRALAKEVREPAAAAVTPEAQPAAIAG